MPQKPCERIDGNGSRCGHPVGGGGNMHAKDRCPAAPRPGTNRRARKSGPRRAEQRRRNEATRLQAVAEKRAEARSAAKGAAKEAADKRR